MRLSKPSTRAQSQFNLMHRPRALLTIDMVSWMMQNASLTATMLYLQLDMELIKGLEKSTSLSKTLGDQVGVKGDTLVLPQIEINSGEACAVFWSFLISHLLKKLMPVKISSTTCLKICSNFLLTIDD